MNFEQFFVVIIETPNTDKWLMRKYVNTVGKVIDIKNSSAYAVRLYDDTIKWFSPSSFRKESASEKLKRMNDEKICPSLIGLIDNYKSSCDDGISGCCDFCREESVQILLKEEDRLRLLDLKNGGV